LDRQYRGRRSEVSLVRCVLTPLRQPQGLEGEVVIGLRRLGVGVVD
jgi:hypothetical protein